MCGLFTQFHFTSVGHGRLNDVQCRVVFTQVVGHVPIGVDRQQICTAVEQGVEKWLNTATNMWVIQEKVKCCYRFFLIQIWIKSLCTLKPGLLALTHCHLTNKGHSKLS